MANNKQQFLKNVFKETPLMGWIVITAEFFAEYQKKFSSIITKPFSYIKQSLLYRSIGHL